MFLTRQTIMGENTLGEWSDGDDDWIWDVDESDLWEWSDPEADDIIRNIDVQSGRGVKRKSDEPLLPEKDFYEKESVTKHKSKKFRMTATDHTIRFNNVLNELDLIESYERTQAIIEHLLNDVTQDMNEKDQVRFVLRSEQLDTPISIPFMPVEQLTTERVFSQIERVIQSNRDFRLNDTVMVDIIHVLPNLPNLCIVHNEQGKEKLFQGSDTLKKFCEWLLTKEHQDCIVVAHNFQGYDGYFIQNYLNKNAIKYEVILRGAKILSMTIPMFNIKFIDSLNFIPMSLSKFPKTFGMSELCKGYFPHLFNKEENQNYVGPIPDADHYSPNTMKPEAREAFLAWHKEQVESNYLFDFKKEIVKYCRSDVDILRKCCMIFREMLRNETGIDPFGKCLTIASYCHEVYRTNYLKKDTIAVFQHDRQLKMKQSNMAVKWLSYEMESKDIHIQHVRNGGEKRVGKYSLDGYCEENHTAYEFQGCFWHGK